MAEETINLFEINIDVDAAVKDTQRLKQEIEVLKSQTALAKKEQGEFSEEYIKYNAALKSAQSDLRTQEKLTQNIISANVANAGSIDQLRKQLSVVSKQWADLSEEERNNTEEGQRLTKQKLDLTEALKAEEKATGDSRRNVGNYSEALSGANLNLQGFVKGSQEAGGAFNFLKGGLKAATQGMLQFTKATLAFILTPVGIVLAAIAGAFLLIKNALDRSEESTAKLKRGFAAFGGIAKGLLKLLEPLGKFLIDGLVKGFELVEKSFFSALNAIQKGLRFLGLDSAADKLNNFTQEIEKAAEASKQLVDAELALEKAQREARKTQLEFQKQAEKLRQIRDDESKSIEERIKANQRLGVVLNKQLNEELALAQKALDLANLRIQLEGETKDALDARAQAETEIVDIQERIIGQQSEQLVNINSLRKEQLALLQAQKDFNEQLVSDSEDEIDLILDNFAEEIEGAFKRNQALFKANQEKAEQFKEARLLEFEAEYAANQDQIYRLIELDRQKLEQQRLLEVAYAEKIGADVNVINQKYTQANIELSRAERDAKLSVIGSYAQSVAQLFGENTVASRIAAATQATIQTYLGATQAFTAASVFPPPAGQIIGAAAAATIIAAGLKNVQKILSTKSGLPGDSGSVGGVSVGGSPSVPSASSTPVTPQIGQGIISRDMINRNKDIIMQPTLVVDSVTNAQNTQNNISNTGVI